MLLLLACIHVICQLTMSDRVPGLEEEGPKLTQHSGLAVSRRGEGGGGMDLPPRESPLLRSVHDILYMYVCTMYMFTYNTHVFSLHL